MLTLFLTPESAYAAGVKVPLRSNVPARLVNVGWDGQRLNISVKSVTFAISQLLIAEVSASFLHPLNMSHMLVTLPTFHFVSPFRSASWLQDANMEFMLVTLSVCQFVSATKSVSNWHP